MDVLEINVGTREQIDIELEIPEIEVSLGYPMPADGGLLYQLVVSSSDAGSTIWPEDGYYGFSSVMVSDLPQETETTAVTASFEKNESGDFEEVTIAMAGNMAETTTVTLSSFA